MSALRFSREDASSLAAKAHSVSLAARELVSFWSEEPELAGQASVEVLALEAKSILASGAAERVEFASRSPKPVIHADDVDKVFRLDTIASISSARMAGLESSLEEEESDRPMNKLGGIVSLAATVLGIVKTVF